MQGFGTALALPLLEIMLPSIALGATTGKAKRLGIMIMENGPAWRDYKPRTAINSVQALPTSISLGLQDLDPYRNYLTVVSGLDNPRSYIFPTGTSGDGHAATACLLNCDPVKSLSNGTAYSGAQSIDQIIASTLAGSRAANFVNMGTSTYFGKASAGPWNSSYYANSSFNASGQYPARYLDPSQAFKDLFKSSIPNQDAVRAQLQRKK